MLHKLTRLYNQYRTLMWLSGIASTFLVPAVGYLGHVASFTQGTNALRESDPELASSRTLVNPFEWFSTHGDLIARLMGCVMALGTLFLVCLVVLQVFNLFNAQRGDSVASEPSSDSTHNTEHREGKPSKGSDAALIDDYGSAAI